MFRVDQNLSHIAATRGQVVSIIQSINHPHVGVPGHATQATEGTLVGIRNSGGTFSIFVHLFLVESKVPVVYVHDAGDFDVETYPEVEGEALEFVESMGFMVDNLNFRNLSPLQQEELMDRLPCFNPDPGAPLESEEMDADPVELEEIDEGGAGSWSHGGNPENLAELETLEDLEELEELDELEEIEPVELAARLEPSSNEPLPSDVSERVGRLLASF